MRLSRTLPFLLLLALLATSPVAFRPRRVVEPPPLLRLWRPVDVERHSWFRPAGDGLYWGEMFMHLYDPETGAASFPVGPIAPGEWPTRDELAAPAARWQLEHGWYAEHQWHPGCWRTEP